MEHYSQNKAVKIGMPVEKATYAFSRSMKVTFVVYVDFECFV